MLLPNRSFLLFNSGVVLPSDTDFLLSFMTNSRYLREYDFARFEHATRSGLMEFVMKRGGSFPVSAIHMRYRQPAMIFSAYKVNPRKLRAMEETRHF